MTEDDKAEQGPAPPVKTGVTFQFDDGVTAFFEDAVITDAPAKPPPTRLQSAQLVWWSWLLLAAGWLAQAGLVKLGLEAQFGEHGRFHNWVMREFWLVMLLIFAINLYLPYGFAFMIALAAVVVVLVVDGLHRHVHPETFAYLALLAVGSFTFTCTMAAMAPRFIADAVMLARGTSDRRRDVG